MAAPDPTQHDDLLTSVDCAAFTWDLSSDVMAWGNGVQAVLTDIPAETIATGRRMSGLIEKTPGIRLETIVNSAARDCGEGIFFNIEYGLRASSSAPLVWIEESGRWFAGADGKPAIVRGIVRVINERHARDEQLLKLSQYDPLTGELNRTRLIAALAESVEEAIRFRTSFAFVLVAIDNLARVNDSFGFDVADDVVNEVAKRIRARLRGADVLGRFSGNKFGIVLKNCSADEMNTATERFLAGIRDEVIPTKSGPVSITASIGGVIAPRYARTAEEAVSRAQEALDGAKSRRRGSFAAWQPSVEREAQRRVNIRVTEEIVTALNDRRVVVAFEPVVCAETRAPRFYECLVRVKHDGGLMLAPDIVPVAEKLGLIRLVDHRVLELAIEQLIAARDVELSINISPDTTTDPDWWSSIEAAMKSHPSIGARLIVEITETVAIQHLDDVRGFVARLKNFGCRIAVDDFGAGYTSFRNLRKLGVDIVKIDGAFVQNLLASSDDRAFVQTMIDLSRRLELKTVAEWVQDEESAALLREWGCDYIQGRFIGLASAERPWVKPVGAVLAGAAG